MLKSISMPKKVHDALLFAFLDFLDFMASAVLAGFVSERRSLSTILSLQHPSQASVLHELKSFIHSEIEIYGEQVRDAIRTRGFRRAAALSSNHSRRLKKTANIQSSKVPLAEHIFKASCTMSD